MQNLKFAVYLAIALVPALVLHEYAHALVATRSETRHSALGRLTLNPKPLIDPFGSLILPALALILVAARGSMLLPVFAYAKPMPVDPTSFRNPRRDMAWVVLAGLGANIGLAIPAGLVIRAGVSGGTPIVRGGLAAGQRVHVRPPADAGARTGRVEAPGTLPAAQGAGLYANLDQYLVLFILVIFFLLAGPLLAIVRVFADLACNLAAGIDCPV